MIYGADPRALAERLDGHEAVETAAFLEDGEAIARRDGVDVPLDELGYPDGPARIRAALANPNAGEVILSAAPGWEFADLGGRHHAGGGSHGSLTAGDSEVPMLTDGLCAGERPRFLALAAAEVREDEIAVSSALTLLTDVELAFYRAQGTTLRGRGLHDAVLGNDWRIEALVTEEPAPAA